MAGKSDDPARRGQNVRDGVCFISLIQYVFVQQDEQYTMNGSGLVFAFSTCRLDKFVGGVRYIFENKFLDKTA